METKVTSVKYEEMLRHEVSAAAIMRILMFRTVFWQYNPEDSSEHHTRRREDLKSQ
jgi:hypothetical protein